MLLSEASAHANPVPTFHPTFVQDRGPHRILLAYDFPIVRQAIRSQAERLGYEIAGEAASGADALRLSQQLEPDLIVLDLEMPFVDGVSLVREMVSHCRTSRIVVLTSRAEPQYVRNALWAGVRGYVLKSSDPADLYRAIHEVIRGGLYYCPEVSQGIGVSDTRNASLEKPLLTDRERQVVTLIADGYSTKQVAGELGISVKTADSHRTRVMEKLNIHETASLVRFAVRQGLVQP